MEVKESFSIVITAGLGGSDYLTKSYTLKPSSGFSYKIDDASAPDCLKAFYGTKTIIVPLRNLVFFETDL